MQRRDFLSKAGSASLLLFAPAAAKLLTALDRPGQDQRFPPPTCGDLGLTGTYPHCYNPNNYLNLNVALANATTRARAALTLAIYQRSSAIPQALANLKYYNPLYINHLYATRIAETHRIQYGVLNYLLQGGPTTQQVQWAQQFAQNNGMPQTLYANLVYDGNPLTTEQQIEQLSTQGGLDNAYALENQYYDSITYEGSGFCSWLGNPQTAIDNGNADMAYGAIIGGFGAVIPPPLGPLLLTIGGGVAAAGGLEYILGADCSEQ